MTKILNVDEIENKTYPQSALEIRRVSHEVEKLIFQAFAEGEIVSASSYGSAYQNNSKKLLIASDVDWLIVFKNVNAMLESDSLMHVFQKLNTSHIPFNSPILSIENIQCGNHLIAPLLAGVRIAAKRVIVGEDPLKLFSQYGIAPDDRRVISSIFSSFLRYFFESALRNHDTQPSGDLIGQLQRAIDYFQETYRTMIVANDQRPENIDYKTYEAIYAEKINVATVAMGKSIDQFIQRYKQMIATVIHNRSKIESEHELDDLTSNYISFLRKDRGVVKKAVLFCQENIKYYYNNKCGK